MPYLVKVVLSALLIVAITELSKRFQVLGSLLAGLPLISIITIIWIYYDTNDIHKVATFSTQVFWFVIPSLGMFLALPYLLTKFSFFTSLVISSSIAILLFMGLLGIFKICHYNPFS